MRVPMLHRREAGILALLVVLMLAAAAALAPRLGLGAQGPAPLWSEQSDPRPSVPPPPWVELARRLKPAVVNISVHRAAEAGRTAPFPNGGSLDDFFRQFFGNRPPRPVQSLGSGFIVNADGYIVTNNHVVDDARDVTVRLGDGREFPASVVGRDPKTDLALLSIGASGLPVIPLGDSARLQVGEPVMAIGNPFGLEQTVTTGIVSATGRVIGEGPYDDFIQTDASINPGNSGGPLINAAGEAIGINSAIFSQNGGSVGIGFAIPINVAKPVVRQLAATGHVVRGWLGVAIQPLTPTLAKSFRVTDTHGAVVASVLDGSPASQAGLKPGDVITRYDGRPIARADELPRAVAETAVDREVPLTVVRDGKELTLTARIGRLAESEGRSAAGEAGPTQPTLGLALESVTPERARELGLGDQRGALVRGVGDESPAATAGLEPGDVIVEIDRQPVKDVADVRRILEHHPTGQPALFRVHRKDASLYFAVDA